MLYSRMIRAWFAKAAFNMFSFRSWPLARWILAELRRLDPRILYEEHKYYRWREQSEAALINLSLTNTASYDGAVLVDATWDNPNYWIRYALVRSALGLVASQEIGVVGPHRSGFCSATLKRFGVREIHQVSDLYGDLNARREQAGRLLASTKEPGDILHWKLPEGVPADIVYDGILKRQRAASVDLRDPELLDYVAEALGSINASQRLVDIPGLRLVVLSHSINFQYGSLAWIALRRNIPVVVLYGDFGMLRFARLSNPADIYNTMNRPTSADIAVLSPVRADAMASIGSAYLAKRRRGQTNDLGGRYAYQRRQGVIDRAALAAKFGWNPQKPIISIYAANWFDMPHNYGMTHFRDFLDWLQATVSVATSHVHINWLFKAHPCDDWYGGVTISDFMPDAFRDHIRLADKTWNGSALMDCVDGLVTYHGTAGIEFAAAGKPVLLADRGWYHDVGFAKWPKSRQEYLDALASEWWSNMNLEETSHRAQIFAGWYFARPAWQDNFVLDDDSAQWTIYGKIPAMIERSPSEIAQEIQTIRDWFKSGHPHYHTYKMRLADEYTA